MVLSNKKVCIFMQVYRNEETMHKAIQSVLGQTYSDFVFCILVSSATKSVIEEYARKDSRIEIYEGKVEDSNKTYYRRLVEIVKQSGCDYFTNIDADDWYDLQYIETLVNYIVSQKIDIVACGNYFVNDCDKIIGLRSQIEMCWIASETYKVIPFVYGFFRTMWGKMISSSLITSMALDKLPETTEYGGYGGDTIFTYNLFRNAKRIAVIDKNLYYYRTSQTGGSHAFKEGRLDSDDLLFNYVRELLVEIGGIDATAESFLYKVYGNALKDTIKLILENDNYLDNLIYTLDKELVKNLFTRELSDEFKNDKLSFSKDIYHLVFHNRKLQIINDKDLHQYQYIFEHIFCIWKGAFSEKEFYVLLKNIKLLDNLIALNYETVFDTLLIELNSAKNDSQSTLLTLLKRASKNDAVKAALIDKNFIIRYSNLLSAVNRNDEIYFYDKIKNKIEKEKNMLYTVTLAELWINFSAINNNAAGFVSGKKQLMLIWLGAKDVEKAQAIYNDLKEMGLDDEEMKTANEKIQQRRLQ